QNHPGDAFIGEPPRDPDSQVTFRSVEREGQGACAQTGRSRDVGRADIPAVGRADVAPLTHLDDQVAKGNGAQDVGQEQNPRLRGKIREVHAAPPGEEAKTTVARRVYSAPPGARRLW